MNHLLRTPLVFMLALCGGGSATAQLFDGGLRAAGPPCDTTLVVDFTVTDNGTMSYTFTPAIDTGDVTITAQTWNYFNVVPLSNLNPSFTAQFLTTGPTPVCLTIDALDPLFQQCSTTACKVVTIYADSICATLQPDFTISNIQGNTVTFSEQSTFWGTIDSYTWDFGDGSTDTGASPMHTFLGNGPYEVCLTVTGAPPDSVCAATKCKWLYLGPGNLPCPTLLQAGFLSAVVDNTVGVLDTSITTGMNYSVEWDFGDGTTASGQVAYHTYTDGGSFSVCETVSLWGPLTPDTCVSTVCTPVFIATVGLAEPEEHTGPRVWPVPAQGRLFVDGLPPQCARLDLVDAMGRQVRSYPVRDDGVLTLDVQGLAPGLYTLHSADDRPRHGVRVLLE